MFPARLIINYPKKSTWFTSHTHCHIRQTLMLAVGWNISTENTEN